MKEAIDIMQKEIDWCRENAGNNPSEFRLGFMRGLEQAKALIGACLIEKAMEDGTWDDNEVNEIVIRSPYGDTIGKVNVR